jgi:uncharacterized protein YutD
MVRFLMTFSIDILKKFDYLKMSSACKLRIVYLFASFEKEKFLRLLRKWNDYLFAGNVRSCTYIIMKTNKFTNMCSLCQL